MIWRKSYLFAVIDRFFQAEFILQAWGASTPDRSCFGSGVGLSEENTAADISAVIPKMLQRRLSPLARAVFKTVDRCLSDSEALPAIFSSAHGEVGKALAMLQTIQSGEEISPTAFSLSVHNAIAGLFSIAYGNRQEITVLAPACAGLAPGFLEALGMFQEGAKEVLVVFYDEPIAAFYPTEPFQLNGDGLCALALRLAKTGTGTSIRLRRIHAAGGHREQPLYLPAFIEFLEAEPAVSAPVFGGDGWEWEKIYATN